MQVLDLLGQMLGDDSAASHRHIDLAQQLSVLSCIAKTSEPVAYRGQDRFDGMQMPNHDGHQDVGRSVHGLQANEAAETSCDDVSDTEYRADDADNRDGIHNLNIRTVLAKNQTYGRFISAELAAHKSAIVVNWQRRREIENQKQQRTDRETSNASRKEVQRTCRSCRISSKAEIGEIRLAPTLPLTARNVALDEAEQNGTAFVLSIMR